MPPSSTSSSYQAKILTTQDYHLGNVYMLQGHQTKTAVQNASEIMCPGSIFGGLTHKEHCC